MIFNNYVYGNIRVEEKELTTGKNPETSLIWKLKGIIIKDDNGNKISLLVPCKGQRLFMVEQNGLTHTETFKELDEEGNFVMENGASHDLNGIVFIGEIE